MTCRLRLIHGEKDRYSKLVSIFNHTQIKTKSSYVNELCFHFLASIVGFRITHAETADVSNTYSDVMDSFDSLEQLLI